jgi:hypothetical protein
MNCYKESTNGLFLHTPNSPYSIRSFTVMVFAIDDLAVKYVFRQDELGKLSDVNS